MKYSLTVPILILAATLAVVGKVETRDVQDKTPAVDYADRQPPAVSAEVRRDMEARLAEARKNYEAHPRDPDAIIWLGRRLAYLGRFREAIESYTDGIKKFPSDARFYRHRGHRYITLRRFDLAIDDLTKAAKLIKGKPDEVEPDGQPNARNIPTSTLQFNIWYHLGLAQYLTGNANEALRSYRRCLDVSENPDALVATTHWLYMTLRRMNKERDAQEELEPISEGMDIIENTGYYRLLLMYRGLISPEKMLAESRKQPDSSASLSVLYGIANWYFYNGRREDALKIFREMVAGDQWTSFGYIAAEADLKRLST